MGTLNKGDFAIVKNVIFFGTIFLFSFALGVRYNCLDADIWARLINGGFVAHGFKPLYNDIFSFTPTHTWYDPEWLSSVSLYYVQKWFGAAGLTVLKCLLCFLIPCCAIYVVKKLNTSLKVNNILFFALFCLIMLQMGYLFFSARCQLYTFIIFVFWLYFLEKIRKNDNKYLYFAPFLMLLWQNVHGGCIAGFGVLFLYIIGEFLNRRPVKKLIFLLLILIPIFAINPWGLEYFKFIYDSAFVDRSYINEWRSSFEIFDFYKNSYFYFILILLSSWLFQSIKRGFRYKDIDRTKVLLVFTVLYLSIKCAKHIGLGLGLLTVFLYKDFELTYDFILDKLKVKKWFKNVFNGLFTLLLFGYSAFVLISTHCLTSYQGDFVYAYPGHMLEFLKENNIKGKILASFQHSSFIAYKYFPDLKIYMDGRQEQVYYPNLSSDLSNFLDRKGDNPDYILETYNPDIVLLYNFELANEAMQNNDKYFMIAHSKYYSLYVLNKYKKENSKQITKTNEEYFKTLFETNIDFSKRNYE